jgi:hypothetical protein
MAPVLPNPPAISIGMKRDFRARSRDVIDDHHADQD